MVQELWLSHCNDSLDSYEYTELDEIVNLRLAKKFMKSNRILSRFVLVFFKACPKVRCSMKRALSTCRAWPSRRARNDGPRAF